MRRALALALLLCPMEAAAFCRTTTTARQPNPTMCTPTGSPVAWTTGCTSVRVDPRVLARGITADDFRLAVRDSILAWKTVVCDPVTLATPSFELVLYPDSTAPVGYFEGAANDNAVLFRATWGDDAFHDTSAAAITVVTFGSRSAAILDADTEFNANSLYPFSVDGGASSTDLRTVAVHELGHTQGLAHSPDRNAVMWYTAGRGERRRTPNTDDVMGICAIYPPGRAVRCDPELRAQTLAGGGVSCASGPRRARRPWATIVLALVALAARRLRR